MRARLGDEAVQGLGFQSDHRPECAWQPTLLAEHGVQILMGPERIESGWWDGADVRRDYYLVQTRAGQQGWAYRTVGQGDGLWLQGWFA